MFVSLHVFKAIIHVPHTSNALEAKIYKEKIFSSRWPMWTFRTTGKFARLNYVYTVILSRATFPSQHKQIKTLN